MTKKIITGEKALQYRCPACHYIVEKDILFGQGCPICGWVSPLVIPEKANAVENIFHADVIEEDDIIRITTGLPVIDENKLKLYVIDSKLLISAGGFKRTIPLRFAVKQIIEKTYRNGVLEVKLRKTGE